MNHLKENVSDYFKQMITATEYEAYRSAASNGHIPALKFLEDNAPNEVLPMIRARSYGAYLSAAKNGHLMVLLHIEERASERLQEMISMDRFRALRDAIQNDQVPVAEHLLSYATVYGFAEMHQDEPKYPELVIAQTRRFLAELDERIASFHEDHPQEHFDFVTASPAQDAQDALYGYYVLRRLIRQMSDNQFGPGAFDQITRLLEIPSIRNLVLHNITSTRLPAVYHLGDTHFAQQPNELIRLAVNMGNSDLRDLLLRIPEVYVEAARHGFYGSALGLNLQVLALDRESSMTALTPAEQKQVIGIKEAYAPLVAKYNKGFLGVINELRQELKKHYLSRENLKERQVKFRGKFIELPFDHSEFLKLIARVKPSEAELLTLKAVYYQNKYHSAWRYLAVPNKWIDPDASFVNVNPGNTKERWSSFEPYQDFIADLYMAAKDETRPPVEKGVTVADRMNLFFQALALINRQHNWDKTRHKRGADNQPMYNPFGLPIFEEYDDGAGDKPSCFSGMKRTLFQALLGHPLYTPLDDTIMRQFINELIRMHYVELLRVMDWERLETIQTDVDNLILDGEEESPTLKELYWLNGKDDIKHAIDSVFRERGEPYYHLIEERLYPGARPNTFIGNYPQLEFDKLLTNLIAVKKAPPAVEPVTDPNTVPVSEATQEPVDENDDSVQEMNSVPAAGLDNAPLDQENDNNIPNMNPVIPQAAQDIATERALNLAGIREQYESNYKTQHGGGKLRFFKLPIKQFFKQKSREAELNFLTAIEALCAGENELSTDQKDRLTLAAAKLVSLKISSERFGKGSLLAKILDEKLSAPNVTQEHAHELIWILLDSEFDVPQHLRDYYAHAYPRDPGVQPH